MLYIDIFISPIFDLPRLDCLVEVNANYKATRTFPQRQFLKLFCDQWWVMIVDLQQLLLLNSLACLGDSRLCDCSYSFLFCWYHSITTIFFSVLNTMGILWLIISFFIFFIGNSFRIFLYLLLSFVVLSYFVHEVEQTSYWSLIASRRRKLVKEMKERDLDRDTWNLH